MSKEEYREFKRKEREQQTAQRRKVQEAMDRGEEKYLLARDRGVLYAIGWIPDAT